MADPVKDFINFNWKLRQDAARVDNYKKQATVAAQSAQAGAGQWAGARQEQRRGVVSLLGCGRRLGLCLIWNKCRKIVKT